MKSVLNLFLTFYLKFLDPKVYTDHGLKRLDFFGLEIGHDGYNKIWIFIPIKSDGQT